MSLLGSVLLFVVAGLCEIGGGYLVWQWLRVKPIGYGMIGALILVLYGVIPTYQTPGFGRVYAAYGGIFIVLSLLWGWGFDGAKPDRYDVIGGVICLADVGVIMYTLRG